MRIREVGEAHTHPVDHHRRALVHVTGALLYVDPRHHPVRPGLGPVARADAAERRRQEGSPGHERGCGRAARAGDHAPGPAKPDRPPAERGPVLRRGR
ncbi:hypothetical protein ABZV91_21820 [Nocardia sp. NPDC004568]|uniref:hypothetical protein n=1 Tax=Nocardia sp. NPDC004568 TaxID=3154551 RepID=UPI0033BB0822